MSNATPALFFIMYAWVAAEFCSLLAPFGRHGVLRCLLVLLHLEGWVKLRRAHSTHTHTRTHAQTHTERDTQTQTDALTHARKGARMLKCCQ